MALLVPMAGQFIIKLDDADDWGRAERILNAACLTINDKVMPLYAGQVAPERVSALEASNYTKGRR